MYHTPAGDRILEGAEARLFIESLAVVVDLLTDSDCDFGIGPFDDLQRNQKIAALHSAGHALLRAEVSVLPLTAFIEAAVATVYGQILGMIESEIAEQSTSIRPSWRQLVLDACQEWEDIGDLPRANSTSREDWTLLLEGLEDRVLWDRDWELDLSLDVEPQSSKRLKRKLGIGNDYFIAVPPDPTDSQAEQLLAELRELTESAR
jgi:hypothetical protein